MTPADVFYSCLIPPRGNSVHHNTNTQLGNGKRSKEKEQQTGKEIYAANTEHRKISSMSLTYAFTVLQKSPGCLNPK